MPLPGKLYKRPLPKKTARSFKNRIIRKVSAKSCTTMRTGGPARALCVPGDIEDLKDIIRFCSSENTPFQVIGNGSNIIVPDKGTQKVLIRLSSPYFKKIVVSKEEARCRAGASLNALCAEAERRSLGNAEFLIGIPGSVGGAIACNAGAHNVEISDIVKSVECIDATGRLITLKPRKRDFGYRRSDFKKFIIVSAVFTLEKCGRAVIKNRLNRYMERRLLTQDYTAPSAGCVFKNPRMPRFSAGELIDRCGLKGVKLGGAAVSKRHANFIINRNKAATKDILSLIELIKREVKRKEGISLEQEIELIT